MEWMVTNWEWLALAVLVLDKVVAATPCKWDDLLLTSIKGAFAAIGLGKKK